MKLCCISIALALLVSQNRTFAQGTFVYDQQSGDESWFGSSFGNIYYQPLGQSFTPSLTEVDFVRMYVFNAGDSDAVLRVNLRADSLTGQVLGSTSPVAFPLRNTGATTFLFPASVAVTPGDTYYFQPEILSPGASYMGLLVWVLVEAYGDRTYPGGMAYQRGNGDPGVDLWFREGIVVVPEPSSALLFLIGGGVLLYVRRVRHR